MNLERVLCYHPDDQKVMIYRFSVDELQHVATTFDKEIFFELTDEELSLYFAQSPEDNLKRDFIWFQPGVMKAHIMQCTCGKFLESGNNMDKLAKKAVAHHKRTGHTLNPRGN